MRDSEFKFEWKDRPVRVTVDPDDIVIYVDNVAIFDHEFDALKYEEYFDLISLVEKIIKK